MLNINHFRKHKGYCSKCGEPLGFIENYEFFCYKYNNYKKLDESSSIVECEKKLFELRTKFREEITKGDVKRYLISFLNLGEGIRSSDSFNLSPTIPQTGEKELIHWNLLNLVVSNLAINWILEDLNYKCHDFSNFSTNIVMILREWLILYRKKVFLENKLGTFILDKEGKKYFYYYKIWVLYNDSLSQFSIIDPERFEQQELEQLTKVLFEKEKESGYIEKYAKTDFPIGLMSLLYHIYPNKNDRIFSFNDILYDDTGMIPYAINRISTYYNDKRALTYTELGETEKPYFVIRNYNELISETNELP